MQLGPIQRLWVKRLRENPELQVEGFLGFKLGPRKYEACCLGEGLLCLHRHKKQKLPFHSHYDSIYRQDIILDGDSEYGLYQSYEELGLHDGDGSFHDPERGSEYPIRVAGHDYFSLSDMNDEGLTWPEIADVLEKYSQYIFTKSV